MSKKSSVRVSAGVFGQLRDLWSRLGGQTMSAEERVAQLKKQAEAAEGRTRLVKEAAGYRGRIAKAEAERKQAQQSVRTGRFSTAQWIVLAGILLAFLLLVTTLFKC